MSHAIGIDFGTTKTMVSYLNPATGRPELVRLGRDRDSVPTTVHVDDSGEFLFGEDADDLIETDPEGYCRAFKLHLGEEEPVLPKAEKTAEALAARFLGYVKHECEQTVFHGESVDTATLTIPVSFSPARQAALKRAAQTAGFSSVSFLPEPEAAGTAFLRDNPTDKFVRALVLDWGGGTLDIAMISRGEDGTIHADRRCAAGNDEIGGEEMDRALLGKLDELWSNQFGAALLDSGENEPKLLREAEKTKIFLSRKESTAFRRGPKKVEVSRADFNQCVESFANQAADLVRNALSKNGTKGGDDPDAILLIGGTSLIPLVRETMEKEFPGIRVLSWHHSHEAVALGATRMDAVAPAEGKQPASSPGATVDLEHLQKTLAMVERWEQAQGDLSGIEKEWADEIAQAANEGHPRAAGVLGEIFHTGCIGYEKDLQKSLQWASIAAELGDEKGQNLLAYYFWVDEDEDSGIRDSPVQKNLTKALMWAEKAYAGNKSVPNGAWVVIIAYGFDNPDERRIRSVGKAILKQVGNKAPSQWPPSEQILIGVVCRILANIADNDFNRAAGNNEAQNKLAGQKFEYLQKGAEFGNESCIESLKENEARSTFEQFFSNATNNESWGAGTGAAVGAAIGTVIPGIGTMLGAGIGAAVGGIKKWFEDN